MKYLFFWILLISVKSFSQEISPDCQASIVMESDKMTGKSNISAKDPISISEDGGSTGIILYPFLSSDQKYVLFVASGVGPGFRCVDKGDKMYVLFRDGSRLQLESEGKFNCKGNFTTYFGNVFGKKKVLDELATKEIEAIRISSSGGSIERNLTPEQSKGFAKQMSCLKSYLK